MSIDSVAGQQSTPPDVTASIRLNTYHVVYERDESERSVRVRFPPPAPIAEKYMQL
jgi:hypothetical protein